MNNKSRTRPEVDQKRSKANPAAFEAEQLAEQMRKNAEAQNCW
jgi:hypothetical protein